MLWGMAPGQPCLGLGALGECSQHQCCDHSEFVGQDIAAVVCSSTHCLVLGVCPLVTELLIPAWLELFVGRRDVGL